MANIPISLGHPRKPSGSVNIIQNGTHDVTQYASAVVNVPTGGASNVVTGTFTGTTTGVAMDVTLNYTGSGYPVVVVIYPTEGAYKSGGTFYHLVQRYATVYFMAIKCDSSTTPVYNGNNDEANTYSTNNRYKSSASSATQLAAASTAKNYIANDNNATSGDNTVVNIRSKTKMSVFIASTSYGFAANIEYTYHVIYSS